MAKLDLIPIEDTEKPEAKLRKPAKLDLTPIDADTSEKAEEVSLSSQPVQAETELSQEPKKPADLSLEPVKQPLDESAPAVKEVKAQLEKAPKEYVFKPDPEDIGIIEHALMGFVANSPTLQKQYLENKGFEAEIDENGNVQFGAPGEPKVPFNKSGLDFKDVADNLGITLLASMETVGMLAGFAGGTVQGTAAGAGLGTVMLPGAGTLAGGVAGGIVGGATGAASGAATMAALYNTSVQYLQQYMGLRTKYSPEEAARAAQWGFATPLLSEVADRAFKAIKGAFSRGADRSAREAIGFNETDAEKAGLDFIDDLGQAIREEGIATPVVSGSKRTVLGDVKRRVFTLGKTLGKYYDELARKTGFKVKPDEFIDDIAETVSKEKKVPAAKTEIQKQLRIAFGADPEAKKAAIQPIKDSLAELRHGKKALNHEIRVLQNKLRDVGKGAKDRIVSEIRRLKTSIQNIDSQIIGKEADIIKLNKVVGELPKGPIGPVEMHEAAVQLDLIANTWAGSGEAQFKSSAAHLSAAASRIRQRLFEMAQKLDLGISDSSLRQMSKRYSQLRLVQESVEGLAARSSGRGPIETITRGRTGLYQAVIGTIDDLFTTGSRVVDPAVQAVPEGAGRAAGIYGTTKGANIIDVREQKKRREKELRDRIIRQLEGKGR